MSISHRAGILLDEFRQRLASYKVPAVVAIIGEMPCSAPGAAGTVS